MYHLLAPTSFGVRYTIFSQTITLFAQELYAVYDAVTQVVLYNIKYTLFCKIYNTCYSV